MNEESVGDKKRKRLKQTSIEESFKRHRVVEDAKNTVCKPKPKVISMSSNLPESMQTGGVAQDDDTEKQTRRLLMAQAAEKRIQQSPTATTPKEHSDDCVDDYVDVDVDVITEDLTRKEELVKESSSPELDDSPVLFPDSPVILQEASAQMNPAPAEVKVGGSPLSSLNRMPSCCTSLQSLILQPDHSVLLRPSSIGNFAQPPRPSYNTYRDKWDKHHVRMPCSNQNLYPVLLQNSSRKVQNRWQLIQTTLLGSIKSSYELQDAILKYNAHYSNKWNFEVLHSYLNEVLDSSERETFFNDTIPAMINLLQQLPSLCTEAIPLLKQAMNHSVTVSQQQVACLLVNAFFCTFPRRNSQKHSEYSTFPDINFNRLFQASRGNSNSVKIEKLKGILHYFKRVTKEMPTGSLTFQRQHVHPDAMPEWDSCSSLFTKLHVSSQGTIEDDGSGFLQVDFANKYIGGGVIGEGCVQEEIRFIICPEMILSRLFCERLDDNECLIITGAERFSDYSGYAHTFKWTGDNQDETPRDSWGRRHTQVVAIDAQIFRTYCEQFHPRLLTRELNKAYCGFCSPDEFESRDLPAIATGNWGCGAFGGDARVKGLVQMMAAAASTRDLVYFTFGDSELAQDLLNVHAFVIEKGLTVGDIWASLQKYDKDASAATSGSLKLYPFIFKLHEAYDCDTDNEQELSAETWTDYLNDEDLLRENTP